MPTDFLIDLTTPKPPSKHLTTLHPDLTPGLAKALSSSLTNTDQPSIHSPRKEFPAASKENKSPLNDRSPTKKRLATTPLRSFHDGKKHRLGKPSMSLYSSPIVVSPSKLFGQHQHQHEREQEHQHGQEREHELHHHHENQHQHDDDHDHDHDHQPTPTKQPSPTTTIQLPKHPTTSFTTFSGEFHGAVDEDGIVEGTNARNPSTKSSDSVVRLDPETRLTESDDETNMSMVFFKVLQQQDATAIPTPPNTTRLTVKYRAFLLAQEMALLEKEVRFLKLNM